MEYHQAPQSTNHSENVPNHFQTRMEAGWKDFEQRQHETCAEFRSQLGDAEYWEELYSGSPAVVDGIGYETFDWLAGWSVLGPLMGSLVAQSDADPAELSVLHVGCGNSTMPKSMHDAGYAHQTCVDLSASVIQQMKSLYHDHPGLDWVAADCVDLGGVFSDETFDLIVDKSTFDAISCHDQQALMLANFLKEMSRVLKYGGRYALISLHCPDDVLQWLHRAAFGWRVRSVPLGKPKDHTVYAYICSRNRTIEQSLGMHWPDLLRHVEAHPDSDVEGEELQSSDEDGRADYVRRTDERQFQRKLRLQRRKHQT